MSVITPCRANTSAAGWSSCRPRFPAPSSMTKAGRPFSLGLGAPDPVQDHTLAADERYIGGRDVRLGGRWCNSDTHHGEEDGQERADAHSPTLSSGRGAGSREKCSAIHPRGLSLSRLVGDDSRLLPVEAHPIPQARRRLHDQITDCMGQHRIKINKVPWLDAACCASAPRG